MARTTEKDFEEQHDNEDVLVLSNNHPVVLRKPLLIALVIIVITMVPFSVNPFYVPLLWLAAAGFVIALLVLFYNWIGWHFSCFVITTERLIQIKQSGFFKRSVVEIGLSKIQNVNYSVDGLQQHLLHFGDVTIQTYAGDLVLKSINHPGRFHGQLTDAIRKYAPRNSAPDGIKGE
jgi:uncharacterized membrane protein YdbT with pleckstrin-like domain